MSTDDWFPANYTNSRQDIQQNVLSSKAHLVKQDYNLQGYSVIEQHMISHSIVTTGTNLQVLQTATFVDNFTVKKICNVCLSLSLSHVMCYMSPC